MRKDGKDDRAVAELAIHVGQGADSPPLPSWLYDGAPPDQTRPPVMVGCQNGPGMTDV